jgi:hypothetical protein
MNHDTSATTTAWNRGPRVSFMGGCGVATLWGRSSLGRRSILEMDKDMLGDFENRWKSFERRGFSQSKSQPHCAIVGPFLSAYASHTSSLLPTFLLRSFQFLHSLRYLISRKSCGSIRDLTECLRTHTLHRKGQEPRWRFHIICYPQVPQSLFPTPVRDIFSFKIGCYAVFVLLAHSKVLPISFFIPLLIVQLQALLAESSQTACTLAR